MVHLHDTPGAQLISAWSELHAYVNQDDDLPLADLAVMGTWRLWHLALPAIPLA
jgi:hypothetical protein